MASAGGVAPDRGLFNSCTKPKYRYLLVEAPRDPQLVYFTATCVVLGRRILPARFDS